MGEKNARPSTGKKCDRCHSPLAFSKNLDGEEVWRCTFCGERYYRPIQGYQGASSVSVLPSPRMTPTRPSAPPPEPHLEKIGQCFGNLAGIFAGYRERQSQLRMAEEVARAVVTRRIAVIEAGVGIGKTFAYIIPTLVERHIAGSSRPLLISTKTISLQEQLCRKDLPVISRLLRMSGIDVGEIVLSKGMQHYCCRERLSALGQSRAEGMADLEAVSNWLLNSPDGDMSAEDFPSCARGIRESIGVVNCHDRCHQNRGCKYFRMRSKRQTCMGVVVTNHNQLVNHLIKRSRDEPGLWLDPFAIVIDEAHSLEEATRAELAVSLSPEGIAHALSEVAGVGTPKTLRRSLGNLEDLLKSASPASTSRRSPGAIRFHVQVGDSLLKALVGVTEGLYGAYARMGLAADCDARARRGSSVVRDIFEECRDMAAYMQGKGDDGRQLFWVELNDHTPNLVMAPLDIGPFLRKTLWRSSDHATVLTSATLGTPPGLEDHRSSVGLSTDSRVNVNCFPPCFDYANRVLIYVPRDIAEPDQSDDDQCISGQDAFCSQAAGRIRTLLGYSHGRALLLFTSYRRLDIVYSLLKGSVGYRLLRQGEASPGELLSTFRRETDSVLFATGSFWEGTDVAGEALSMVVMDKLPFPVPSDPLVAARSNLISASEGDAFNQVLRPMMLRVLRQGAGRLIRQEGDKGVIAVLDVRTWTRHYHAVKKTLPPAPWTDDLGKVKAWFESRLAT